jgi:23S rRNA (cytidine1920-2'-O)/16S rRNA (cytidine1409-2'-O)-methyltransferase
MRIRLDAALVGRGLCGTRTKAQAAVMAGLVSINGVVETKAGKAVRETDVLEIAGPACPYVSRGGIKLKAALDEFKISVAGKICADIGASTGGFTDCMLQSGAAKVYAVDVGRGQLDCKLVKDPRVIFMGDTNARFMTADAFPETAKPSFAAIDVSFIPLELVLGPVLGAMARPAQVVALIKPQFELSPKEVPGGIVKSDECREKAVANARGFFAKELAKKHRAKDAGLITSPLKGAKGNVEFLLLIELE